MHTRSKLMLTGIVAALAMSFAVESVSANRLSVSNANLFRDTWLSLESINEEGTALVACPVTLEGSFHSSTLRKVRGALIGLVSRASIRGSNSAGNCTGGTKTILQASLPWHIHYYSFLGTLPRLTGPIIAVHRFAVQLGIFGVFCLYQENGTEGIRGTLNTEANGLVTGLTLDSSARLDRSSGSFLCPARTGFRGTARVSALPGGGNISTRLI